MGRADTEGVEDARTDEAGFGLIELLVAMMILSVGLLALVAGFSSGGTAIRNASKVSTATALADSQMEAYRAIRYGMIALETSSVTLADGNSTYASDPARRGGQTMAVTATCTSPILDTCKARRTAQGPDGRPYLVDTYVFSETPVSGSRPVKSVTIVVRSSVSPYKAYVRAQSTFDCSTGQTSDPSVPLSGC
jgi:prepilin-type N-terminal cleavage/methylation domain-containing protein